MNNDIDQTESSAMSSDLDELKAIAKERGIKHHHNIGVEKLQAILASTEKEKPAPTLSTPEPIQSPQSVPTQLSVSEITELQQLRAEKEARNTKLAARPTETKRETVRRLKQEATRLVRIRVNNMNPNKKEWEGEVFTVSNDVVGTVKKYVAYNNDEGWHVPNIILEHMREKECQIFFTVKDNRGNSSRKGRIIKEMAIDVLPDLSINELHDLKQRQLMAAGNTD